MNSLQSILTANNSFAGIAADAHASELREIIFNKGLLPPKQGAPLLSGHSIGSVYCITDYTATYRALFDVVGLGLDKFSVDSTNLFHKIIHQEGILPGYHSFGLGTALNTAIGIVGMKHDLDRMVFCQKIGDQRGSLKGRIAFVKDAIYASTGVIFGTFRPLAILASIKGIAIDFHAPSLLGRVTYGFVFVGILAYALFFLLLTVIQGLNIEETVHLKHKLEKASNVKERLELLQKKLYVNPEKVLGKLRRECQTLFGKQNEENALQKMLAQEGLRIGKESLKEVLKELNISLPNEEKVKNILKGIISASEKEVESSLIHLGFQMRVQKAAMKKHAKLQRILGNKAFEELSKASLPSLIDRIEKADAEALEKGKAMTVQMQKALVSNMHLSSALLAFGVIGTATMIGAVTLTTGIGLIISSIAMLVFNILSIIVDGYFLKQSYQGEAPAPHDKQMLIASTVVCLVSLLSVVALSATGVFSMGIVPIIIMLILSAIWLGQNAVTWNVMNRIEKENKIKHPTLNGIFDAVNRGENIQLLHQMLANLPKELQEIIEGELRRDSGITPEEMKQAIIQVMQKIEGIKKAQLEKLRAHLQPYLLQVAN